MNGAADLRPEDIASSSAYLSVFSIIAYLYAVTKHQKHTLLRNQ
jgi:hypothetical protein